MLQKSYFYYTAFRYRRMDLLCRDLSQAWLNRHCAKPPIQCQTLSTLLVFSHNPLSSWHLTPSICSYCLYSSSTSFCQTRTCAQQAKYLPLATFNDHYWMTCDWTSCSVLLWAQRWANSNNTVVIIGFSTLKPSGKTLDNTFNWFVKGKKYKGGKKKKLFIEYRIIYDRKLYHWSGGKVW